MEAVGLTENGVGDPDAVADQIAAAARALAGAARAAELDLVAYLLELAELEATRSAARIRPDRR